MRTYGLIVGALVLMVFAASALSQSETDLAKGETSCNDKSSRIMILGTYHMNNPGLDSVNLNADDVLSERRQAEINELLDKLARFKPTKIAIEAQYRSTYFPNRYKKYLTGEQKLGRNETEQIGFQLAKRLNLETVYPVDFSMYKTAPPLSEEDKLLRRSTVTEFLRYLNGEQRVRENNAQYMQMLLPTDNPAIYAQSDLVTNWYKRNLRIFTNVARITDFGKDRILLIIGSGHLKILREFAIDSPNFCLVDTEAYLK